jgi:hypothetical protein
MLPYYQSNLIENPRDSKSEGPTDIDLDIYSLGPAQTFGDFNFFFFFFFFLWIFGSVINKSQFFFITYNIRNENNKIF